MGRDKGFNSWTRPNKKTTQTPPHKGEVGKGDKAKQEDHPLALIYIYIYACVRVFISHIVIIVIHKK